MFIGRKEELADLHAEFAAERPSLVIMYGRRRVGKSTLIQEATRHLPSIYFQATRGLPSDNLRMFKEAATASIGDDGILGGMANWHSTLHHLASVAERIRGLVVTFDEFPFLCEEDKALPSVIQQFMDSGSPRRGNLKLVLCGSVVAHMSELLAEKNPLYGRHTAVFDLAPLPLRDAAAFLPGWPAEDIVTAYGILGGIPYYLETFDPGVSLERNVIDQVLARRGKLTDEPIRLLAAETINAPRYHSIMQAIADGCVTSSAIKDRVRGGEGERDISWYLARLIGMRIVRAERSMDADKRERNRRYVLDDAFMAFWFHFVRPASSAVGLGRGDQVWRDRIAPGLSDYMGNAFEDICRQHVRLHSDEFLGSAVFGEAGEDVGKIWSADYDIDIAAMLLDGSVVFGECKWRNQAMGVATLEDLVASAKRTRFAADVERRHFLLCSKSGFAPDLAVSAEGDPLLHLLTPEDLVRPEITHNPNP
jgi:AAA+ ATPase superfamily predicted ATPase